MKTISRFIIYALVSPESPSDYRYIGKSTSGLDRPREHFKRSVIDKGINPHKCHWIASIQKKLGVDPSIVILEELDGDFNINERETANILKYKILGYNLLNATEGGEGSRGDYSPPEELRKLLSDMNKGKKQTPEIIARKKAAWKAKKDSMSPEEWDAEMARQGKLRSGWNHTEETRSHLSRIKTGTKMPEGYMTEEHRNRIGNLNRGKKFSEEHKQKMSESNKKSWAAKMSKMTPEEKAQYSAKGAAAMKDRHQTEETRKKISEANRGRKASPETRAKMSKAQTGIIPSMETRAKIGAKSKGRRHTEEAKASISAKVKVSVTNQWAAMTPEQREARCASMRGRKLTEEAKKHLSDINKGKKLSMETKTKMAAAKSAAQRSKHDNPPLPDTSKVK